MKPEKIKISFSGGRTSFCMTNLILQRFPDADILVMFANTGLEHPRTLDFVHAADLHWGGDKVHWIEAEFHGGGVGVTAKRVTYESACRDGRVFEDHIKKYGIPNPTNKACTDRLKIVPMTKYASASGFKNARHAIGIRADEIDRMSSKAESLNLWYPLAEWGWTKERVNAYCARFDFDLDLPSDAYGNCVGCYKKSDRKLFTIARQSPEFLDWWVEMGDKYANHHTHDKNRKRFKAVSPDGTRKFYRGHRTGRDIITEAATTDFTPYQDSAQGTIWDFLELDMGGSCDQGCEVYSDD